MKVPKEIAEKVKIYQEGLKAFEDVVDWLKQNTEADGVDVNRVFIVDAPTGRKQDDGEYCEQHSYGCCEDYFYGKYYHPIDGSTQYLGYDFNS